MRIVIATPLFPPDVEEPAPYVKELTHRLALAGHSVVVVLYGVLPEHVDNVRLVPVDKRRILYVRMLSYFRSLLHEARKADVLLVANGPSVELPVLLTSVVTGTPYILHQGDARAIAHAKSHTLAGYLLSYTTRRASAVVTRTPTTRPETMPFGPAPLAALEHYEASWHTHLEELNATLRHATN